MKSVSLEVSSLRYGFPNSNLEIECDDFSGKGGDLIQLYGPSGSGKSTIMACLLGLLNSPIEQARYVVEGVNFSAVEAQRRKILSAMHQNSLLIDHWSVEESIQSTGIAGINRKSMTSGSPDSSEVLLRLGIDSMQKSRCRDLSGGQKRRVAFARAVMMGREVVFLDEPFSQLDDDNRRVIEEEIGGLLERGSLVILSSHEKFLEPRVTYRVGVRNVH